MNLQQEIVYTEVGQLKGWDGLKLLWLTTSTDAERRGPISLVPALVVPSNTQCIVEPQAEMKSCA